MVMKKFKAEIALNEDDVKEAIEKYIRSRYGQMISFAFPSKVEVSIDHTSGPEVATAVVTKEH